MADNNIVSEIAGDGDAPSKRRKIVDDNISDRKDATETLESFGSFSLHRVLNENAKAHLTCVLGSFADRSGDAIVMMEKTPFPTDSLQNILCKETTLTVNHQNDVYGTYTGFPPAEYNSIKVTLIHPATPSHIEKYSSHPLHLISETPEDYADITLPYINKDQLSVKWVQNILDGKAEQDRILLDDSDPDTGFVFLPDMKWNQKQTNDLYLIAITRKKILSIRELTDEHLPMLENICRKGKKLIADKFGICGSQLRIYFHYQPSYYHLHVHFTHVNFDAPGTSTDKAHLLTTVMSNLRLDPMYYKKSILTFRLRADSPLYKLFNTAGRIEK